MKRTSSYTIGTQPLATSSIPGTLDNATERTGTDPSQGSPARAVMDLIKVHRAVMDLIVESPGCYGFTPLIKVHRAVMDLIVESPGCSGFTPSFKRAFLLISLLDY